ncbi:hypothetical protein [Cytobacillus praedii]|uniref:hypothetical protein n=1 Tax=Cytobacillus praedii TaxID=1742358 RepID=UPI0013F48E33|nr:hypothetical protein [Cytobacillus praedii]
MAAKRQSTREGQPDLVKIKNIPFENKIRVNSVKGEPVNVNLPINLIKAAMQILD